MPQRRNVRKRPIDYVRSGTWPNAELDEFVPAVFAQIFARNLVAASAERSLRELGRRADMSPQTIQFLQSGETWPDMVSVAKLEVAFRRLLWPSDNERRSSLTELLRQDFQRAGVLEKQAIEAIDATTKDLWKAFYERYPDELKNQKDPQLDES